MLRGSRWKYYHTTSEEGVREDAIESPEVDEDDNRAEHHHSRYSHTVNASSFTANIFEILSRPPMISTFSRLVSSGIQKQRRR
mmetsp:Transcript_4707/g.11864  ORF Transcript_4707/g.11864 Transcript_4707/m.11864 type:complete len:83 (-) Transcript_4707:2258-2506(-)